MREVLIILLFPTTVLGQKNDISTYSSLYSYYDNASFFLSPVFTYTHEKETNSIWSELRYNYDDIGVFAIYAGYSFVPKCKNETYIEITPNVGYLLGNIYAISPGLNVYFESGNVEAYIQSFNPISTQDKADNFSFVWGECLLKMNRPLVAYKIGPSVQALYSSLDKTLDLGLKFSFEYNYTEIFLYGFEFWDNAFIYVGISFELTYNRNTKKINE